MTDLSNEQFYDTVIAPALLDLAKQCGQRHLSFVAMVEYDLGEVGLTLRKEAITGAQFALAEIGARALGNADRVIFGLIDHAKKHGHQSAFLAKYVPTTARGEP